MVEYRQLDSGDGSFLIQPNRALGWVGMKRLFIALSACVCAVAAYFAAQGAWLVLPFAGLEIAVLALGLYLSARCSATREIVSICGADLTVSRRRRQTLESQCLKRHWTRVVLSQDPTGWYPSRLFLRCHGRQIELGGALLEQERKKLAQDLSKRLGFRYSPCFSDPGALPQGLGAAEQKI
jgi:uncharacterized membrane protein